MPKMTMDKYRRLRAYVRLLEVSGGSERLPPDRVAVLGEIKGALRRFEESGEFEYHPSYMARTEANVATFDDFMIAEAVKKDQEVIALRTRLLAALALIMRAKEFVPQDEQWHAEADAVMKG